MNRLENKVAIVTGGAQGIGATVCEMFVKEGAKVIIADIAETAGKQLEEKINSSQPHSAKFFQLDVTSYEQWQDCIDFTVGTFGKLNILINNAGISIRKDIAGTTKEEWDRTVAIHQSGAFYGMQIAIEAMRNNGEKCAITNASSIEGWVAESEYFAYCGAKGAIVSMTRSAALYCGEQGLSIRVNAILPGYVLTPMSYDEAAQNNQTIEEFSAEAIKRHPIGYLGSTEDIAYGYLYLSSDEAKFITGTTLLIDGGYTAQ